MAALELVRKLLTPEHGHEHTLDPSRSRRPLREVRAPKLRLSTPSGSAIWEVLRRTLRGRRRHEWAALRVRSWNVCRRCGAAAVPL